MPALDLSLRPTSTGVDHWLRRRLDGLHPALRVAATALAGWAALTIVMLAVGSAFMAFALDTWIGDVDYGVTHWLEDHRTAPLNAATDVFSTWADTWTIVTGALGATTVLLVLHRWRESLILLVALPLELSVFLSVTWVVERPRPFVDVMDSVPATASFPSGHMTAAVVLYGGLALVVAALAATARARRWAVTAATLTALAVGGSRVYRGLHHPSDVVAGALLGLACLAVAVVAARAFEGRGVDQ